MNAAPARGVACRILLGFLRAIEIIRALLDTDGINISLHAVWRRSDGFFDFVAGGTLKCLGTAGRPTEPTRYAFRVTGRREIAQIKGLAYRDVEEACCFRSNGEVGKRLDLVQRKAGSAGEGLVVRVGGIITKVTHEPGGDGAPNRASNIKRFPGENGKVIVKALWIGTHPIVHISVAIHDPSHTARGIADSEYP